MKKEIGKVSVGEKLAYAGGDTASNLIWMFMIYYISYYYTDVFKMRPEALALMILVVRLFDTVADPIMGIIADRTESKWGKFRPYLLYTALPFGLMSYLMLTTPEWSEQSKLIYAYITYSLMMVVYTIINIPYSALMGVLSPNTQERTNISSYRFAAAQLGGIFVQVFTVYLVVLFGGGTSGHPENEQLGYSMVGLTYGIAAALIFIACFFLTKERVKPPKDQKNDTKSDIKNLLTNVPWLLLFAVSIFFIAFVCIRGGAILYYFKYYAAEKAAQITIFGKEMFFDYASMFMILGTATALITTSFAGQMAKLIGGKKRMFLIFMVLTAIFSFCYYFIPPEATGMMFLFQFLISAVSGPTGALMFAMYADTADYSEWKSGRRATGLIFSAATSAQKLGWTIAGALTGFLLAYYGYTANNANADAVAGINLLISIYPAIGAAIAALIVFFYPLSDKRMAQIEEDLIERRKAEGQEIE